MTCPLDPLRCPVSFTPLSAFCEEIESMVVMRSWIRASARYVWIVLGITLGGSFISGEACADQKRDRAFKHFSQGKRFYEQKQYKRAEESFERSLEYIKDHQSLYYRALSISKQSDQCEATISAWRDYLNFCDQRKDNCVKSWRTKAQGHQKSAQERCVTNIVPRNSSGACPQGSSLIDGQCVFSRMDCLPDKVLYQGRCIAKLMCPPDMTQEGSRCVSRLGCPAGMVREGIRCVVQDACSDDEVMVPGEGCSARVVTSAADASGNLFTMTPVWGYVAMGVGVTSHVINLFSNSGAVLDTTFITTLTGYAIGAVGIGVGVYRSANASPTSSPAELGVSSSLHSGRTASPLHTTGSGFLFRWSGSF